MKHEIPKYDPRFSQTDQTDRKDELNIGVIETNLINEPAQNDELLTKNDDHARRAENVLDKLVEPENTNAVYYDIKGVSLLRKVAVQIQDRQKNSPKEVMAHELDYGVIQGFKNGFAMVSVLKDAKNKKIKRQMISL